jgi:hypothetical protein
MNRLKEIFSATEGIRDYAEARTTFEKQLIYDALDAASGDKEKAARYLGDSLRTLNRRMAELGIETTPREEEQRATQQEAVLEEKVKSNEQQQPPAHAVDAIERFRQLQKEYDAKREAARENKEVKKRKQAQWRMAA